MSLLFFGFIIFLVVGGYIYTKDLKYDKQNIKDNKTNKSIDYRIDKKRDYIYFDNETIVSSDPEITFSDIVINIEGADIINSSLKSEMDNLRNSVVKLDETNIDLTKELLYAETDIYSVSERTYELHKNRQYKN